MTHLEAAFAYTTAALLASLMRTDPSRAASDVLVA